MKPTKIENSSHVHYHTQIFGYSIAGAALFIVRGMIILLALSVFRSVLEERATVTGLAATPSLWVLLSGLVGGHEWIRRWWQS